MATCVAYDIKSWGCKAEHPHDPILQGSTAEASGTDPPGIPGQRPCSGHNVQKSGNICLRSNDFDDHSDIISVAHVSSSSGKAVSANS